MCIINFMFTFAPTKDQNANPPCGDAQGWDFAQSRCVKVAARRKARVMVWSQANVVRKC